jgi:hypothetical protein
LEVDVATQIFGRIANNGYAARIRPTRKSTSWHSSFYFAGIGRTIWPWITGTRGGAKELLRFVDWAKKAGVRRLLVNGSYITTKARPTDVDIVILPGSDEDMPSDEEIKWPFLHILIAVDEADLKRWADEDFGSDRQDHRKGIVEVIL